MKYKEVIATGRLIDDLQVCNDEGKTVGIADKGSIVPIVDDDGDFFVLISPIENSTFTKIRKEMLDDVRYEPGIMFVKAISNISHDVNDLQCTFGEGDIARVKEEDETFYVLYSKELNEEVNVVKSLFVIDRIVGFDFEVYSEFTAHTAVYPKERELEYLGFGLVGEAGELSNKFKKIFRDDNGIVSEDREKEIIAEVGDILWYCAQISNMFDKNMNEIALENLSKLRARQANNTLHGSGDKR